MLEIQKSYIGKTILLDISGRIDAINSDYFQDEINRVIASENENDLLLRMADVNYLSAAGLRVLRSLKQQSDTVRIVEPAHRVIEVMQITGLDAIYDLYPTLTDALHQIAPIINAHTHLELGWLNSGLPDITGKPFVPWLNDAIKEPFQSLPADYHELKRQAIESGIEQLQASGVTMVGDVSYEGDSIDPLLKARMRGIVYIEILGANPAEDDMRFNRLVTIIEKWLPKMRNGLKLGISPHAPYSLTPTLWQKVLKYAEDMNLPLCIHVAESKVETQYLKDGTGELVDYFPGREFTPPGLSPIGYLEKLGALKLKPLLVHAMQVDDADIALIKKYDCAVVHCPRSNLRLQCGRMPLEKYLAAGVPVLMGTDSLASSPSLDIFDEIEVAAAFHYDKVDLTVFSEMVHRQLPDV